MANFFLDNKDLQYHLNHPMMKRIIELKERNFADAATYDYAPHNTEDALDSYRRVLEIVGDVCGEVIAANAESVDHEGPRVVNDHVEYAAGTVRNIEALTEAGLSGMTLPRRFDGLNMPVTCFAMANEMVASRISGACRIAPRQSTSSPPRRLRLSSCPVYRLARPAQWTLPSPMQVRTLAP